jgi:hypothetical protein
MIINIFMHVFVFNYLSSDKLFFNGFNQQKYMGSIYSALLNIKRI